ncbi:hypothetical protein BT63DRAFT_460564 [Microthyrium microscopicum]|uniref:DUF7168 domain-containing protein n=1 Tax=Microthyrium microscopicum TaxID=703497 RepID=A0A6A6TW24_9PEZI|nr:hypothetical protein BT63DRAFT_460564 [Microthyrium microscopicum]
MYAKPVGHARKALKATFLQHQRKSEKSKKRDLSEAENGDDRSPETGAEPEAEQEPAAKRNKKKKKASAGEDGKEERAKKKHKKTPKNLTGYVSTVSQWAKLHTYDPDPTWFGRKLEIIKKIAKCIQKATHPGTGSREKEAGWFLATKNAKEINVDIEAIKAWANSKALAGISKSRVKRRDGNRGRQVRNEGFVPNLTIAIAQTCSVRHFSWKTEKEIEHCFYGVAAKTVSAAMQFTHFYNLIKQEGRSRPWHTSRAFEMGVSAGLVAKSTADVKGLEEMKEKAQKRLMQARDLKRKVKHNSTSPVMTNTREKAIEDLQDEIFVESEDEESEDEDDEDEEVEDSDSGKDDCAVDFDDPNFADIDLTNDIDGDIKKVLLRKCREQAKNCNAIINRINRQIDALLVADRMLKTGDIEKQKNPYRPMPFNDQKAFNEGVLFAKDLTITTYNLFGGQDEDDDDSPIGQLLLSAAVPAEQVIESIETEGADLELPPEEKTAAEAEDDDKPLVERVEQLLKKESRKPKRSKKSKTFITGDSKSTI